jgi:hypothetical protein
VAHIAANMTVHRKASIVKPTPMIQKFLLLALLAVLGSAGLTGCKCCSKKPEKSDQPAQSEHPKKAEHPEHPK